ncbi:MAG: hypothetical protein P4L35_01510 [Ignavibacteriaceae bacterium]|nr:hypothetical protein [Ignavibacteriaceae bacterium]
MYTDPKYIQIGKWFDKHHIEFYPSTSIYDDDGHDLLADILKEDEDFYDLKDAEDSEQEEKPVITLLDLNPKPKEKKEKRSKYKELRRLFIFDDLTGEIRWSKSLTQLLKKNRH